MSEDGKDGFKSIGEYLKAVHAATSGMSTDQRLKALENLAGRPFGVGDELLAILHGLPKVSAEARFVWVLFSADDEPQFTCQNQKEAKKATKVIQRAIADAFEAGVLAGKEKPC